MIIKMSSRSFNELPLQISLSHFVRNDFQSFFTFLLIVMKKPRSFFGNTLRISRKWIKNTSQHDEVEPNLKNSPQKRNMRFESLFYIVSLTNLKKIRLCSPCEKNHKTSLSKVKSLIFVRSVISLSNVRFRDFSLRGYENGFF